MRFCAALCIVLWAGAFAWAQDRDFLTPDEADQIREAQEANDRLLLYVRFARQRMDLLQQYLAKEKPGRSIFIHNTLEDYSQIIDAIDTVSDDALRHKRPIDKGMVAVLSAEKDFLDQLNKIQDSEPKDFDRYKFVLTQAIDATTDSRELGMQDSAKRGADLAAADAKEKQQREAMMPAKELADRKKDTSTQDQPKKKVPTLLRPGEKLPDQPQ